MGSMRTASIVLVLALAGLTTHQAYHRLHGRPQLDVALKKHCMKNLGADYVTALMFADDGTFSGSPEALHILANLKGKKEIPVDSTVCGSRLIGKLMGQDVTVITTGIGDVAAAMCAYEVLHTCGAHIKEIIYFGTSGWSPAKGGLLDVDSCGEANTQPQVTRMGDVCVSPLSVDWVCKKASWSQQCQGYPNVCSLPQEAAGPDAAELYGQCIFSAAALHSLALADELLAAAKGPYAQLKAPRRAAVVQANEELYWQRMSGGIGADMPVLATDAAPRLWSYRHCAEVDGRFFYSGVPYEMRSREYVAHTINLGLNHSSASEPRAAMASPVSRAANVSRADVVAVAAMEGVGLAEAVLKYNLLASTARAVPFANVRAMSNWLHQPLQQVAPGNWSYGEEVPEDFVNGYSYAIATGSAYIMSLFRQRCLAPAQQQGQQQEQQRSLQAKEGDSDGLCSYHVDYPGSGTVAGSSGAEAGTAVGLGAYRPAAAGVVGGVGSDGGRLGRDVSSYRLGLQRLAGQSSSVVPGLQGKLGLGQRQQMRLGQEVQALAAQMAAKQAGIAAAVVQAVAATRTVAQQAGEY